MGGIAISRPLSTIAVRSLLTQETDVVWLVMLKISHASMTTPIRVVDNTVDVVSTWEDGSTQQTYQAFPFRISLPQEREDSPPRVQLQIDNVDRRVVEAVRGLSGDVTVTLVVVTDNNFNVPEIGPINFTMKSARYDKLIVDAQLAFEPVLDESYPAGTFNPADFPALFA